MAFIESNLSPLSHADGFTLWVYRAESLDEGSEPGFFSSAAHLFASGDVVMATASDGVQMLHISGSAVTQRSAGTIQ
jgi:hypothetical protein